MPPVWPGESKVDAIRLHHGIIARPDFYLNLVSFLEQVGYRSDVNGIFVYLPGLDRLDAGLGMGMVGLPGL